MNSNERGEAERMSQICVALTKKISIKIPQLPCIIIIWVLYVSVFSLSLSLSVCVRIKAYRRFFELFDDFIDPL